VGNEGNIFIAGKEDADEEWKKLNKSFKRFIC
jgi:hypothetical protein